MIDVVVDEPAWRASEPDAEDLARSAAAAALALEGKSASVVILLSGDDRLAGLNAAFRGKPGPTNVLSFPAAAFGEGRLGDVALAYGVCRREATAQGKPLADHLRHLAAHGVLHLLGYDHESDAEAEAMEAREREILARLGVPDPYRARGA
jgi:probable rRNA maturation factor